MVAPSSSKVPRKVVPSLPEEPVALSLPEKTGKRAVPSPSDCVKTEGRSFLCFSSDSPFPHRFIFPPNRLPHIQLRDPTNLEILRDPGYFQIRKLPDSV
jgi:hypothetical protein